MTWKNHFNIYPVTCDCNDCADSENPCESDCDAGPGACQGCQESSEDAMEREFQWRMMVGGS